MELNKTTILPTDDNALASRMFASLVFEQPYYLLVVLGAGTEAETLVQRADRLAGTPTEPRRVVWARQPNDIRETVLKLNGGQQLGAVLNEARGFALSIGDEVRDIIRQDETVPNLTRVMLAYSRAEAIAG